MKATVRIMNSYDYGHFEITLSGEDLTVGGVNELRAQAQAMVREAVAEYKAVTDSEKAKEREEWKRREDREQEEFDRQYQADIDSGKELPF